VNLDIVTIIFDDEMDLNLLRLQALSFQLVNPDIIGNIFIVYNDSKFTDFKQNIIPVLQNDYPIEFRSKLQFIWSKDLGIDTNRPGWFTQQQAKLLVSCYVRSECYVVLDAKNHFIRKIEKEAFFSNDAKCKPLLYLSDSGPMISHFLNSLDYFRTKNSFPDIKNMPTTVTPYIFITIHVREMLKLIARKEMINIKSLLYKVFFVRGFNYKNWTSDCLYYLLTKHQDESCTEFYLYAAYLALKNKLSSHEEKPVNLSGFCVFKQDPKTHFWNSFEAKDQALKNEEIKVFGLHRNVIGILDTAYKRNLLNMYADFYSNDIVNYIEEKILYN